MNSKPTPPTETPKRATAVPSPETEAIRCLREARKLDATIAKDTASLKEKVAARAKLVASLSPGARQIFDLQMGATSKGEGT